MFKITLRFVLIITLFQNSISAQNHDFCGYQHEIEKIQQKKPQYNQWQNQMYERAISEYSNWISNKRKITSDTELYEIQVVFHVLYNNTEQNIADSYILEQLDLLNQAFRKTTPDTQRIRPVFIEFAEDTKIQFVLAKKDPNGQITNGITRTATTKTTFSRNIFGQYLTDMKYSSKGGKDAWDPTKYLNIWICNMRFPNQVSMTLGFATPPTGAPNWLQFSDATKDTTDIETGVVCHFSTIGSNHPAAIGDNKEGKTIIHEVGHYLGLRHTWGDNPNNGCNVDDGIFDTPVTRDRNYSCNGQNSCNSGNNDLPDMTENYMDYSLDGCAAMFTKQQGYMMRFILDNMRVGLPFRKITNDTLYENKLIVYPNPANSSGFFTIDFETESINKIVYQVELIDHLGRSVLKDQIENGKKNEINVLNIAAGSYYLIIKNASNNIVKKQLMFFY